MFVTLKKDHSRKQDKQLPTRALNKVCAWYVLEEQEASVALGGGPGRDEEIWPKRQICTSGVEGGIQLMWSCASLVLCFFILSEMENQRILSRN